MGGAFRRAGRRAGGGVCGGGARSNVSTNLFAMGAAAANHQSMFTEWSHHSGRLLQSTERTVRGAWTSVRFDGGAPRGALPHSRLPRGALPGAAAAAHAVILQSKASHSFTWPSVRSGGSGLNHWTSWRITRTVACGSAPPRCAA